VLSRSRHVGFRLKKDLAKSVGCSDDQITKWLKLELPPAQMRKGFDVMLCSALKTNRKMLFHDFTAIAPEDAPTMMISGDQVFKSARSDRLHNRPVEETLANIIRTMDLSELESMVEYGTQIVLAKNDSRRPEIERITQGFGSVKIKAK
jgi:hypothetical protein